MKKYCLLWDIDGTLLETHGAGVLPLENAIEREFGVSVKLERGEYSGYTDFEIISALTMTSLDDSSYLLKYESALTSYATALEIALSKSRATALGNIREVLMGLKSLGKWESYIGTGNYEGAATHKLKSAGLIEFFPQNHLFGATSSRMKRPEIIRFARTALANDFEPIVIGDAPADIHAAKLNNLKVIATPTGHHSYEELNSLVPGMVLSTSWSLQDLLEKLTMVRSNDD
ncbi:MAG: HAD hydrolase-like protein [Actinobacteria bacterium]|uniref:Unannotated protein n=1 Tax=freshwater metagenome TaxID=449393 RepID=A0A6J6S3I4_9ZZZZ|nr:HAD hydrolase-like protein [Actinomycetota bacterium]MSX71512.1 HAD hydrolase-like protein [Actinomycetota bacterium]MSY69633.1 HAD hydrolase-like protein [Actinomycetota bacterium]MTA75411.1 HAD hydrolase-like protein [Actinomycetota bacterium]